jgi:hypothetical protein
MDIEKLDNLYSFQNEASLFEDDSQIEDNSKSARNTVPMVANKELKVTQQVAKKRVKVSNTMTSKPKTIIGKNEISRTQIRDDDDYTPEAVEGLAKCLEPKFSFRAYKKRKNLNVRQDVLNKTLLRSLKKYLTKEFDEFTNSKNLTFKERQSGFYGELDRFTADKYTNAQDSKFELSDISAYIGIIVWPEPMKKRFRGNNMHIKFNRKFYECVYKYTHIRLSTIFKDEVFGFLFQHYIQSRAVYEMIESDATLSKNRDAYMRTVDLFKSSFEKGLYINL